MHRIVFNLCEVFWQSRAASASGLSIWILLKEVPYWASWTWQVVYLKNRFGFVKVAIQAGAAVVPCFCFGQVWPTTSIIWLLPGQDFTCNLRDGSETCSSVLNENWDSSCWAPQGSVHFLLILKLLDLALSRWFYVTLSLLDVVVQTNTYRWWKPSGKWYNQMSRKLGFTPLVFWGRFGYNIQFLAVDLCVWAMNLQMRLLVTISLFRAKLVTQWDIDVSTCWLLTRKARLEFSAQLELCNSRLRVPAMHTSACSRQWTEKIEFSILNCFQEISVSMLETSIEIETSGFRMSIVCCEWPSYYCLQRASAIPGAHVFCSWQANQCYQKSKSNEWRGKTARSVRGELLALSLNFLRYWESS